MELLKKVVKVIVVILEKIASILDCYCEGKNNGKEKKE